MRSIVGPLGGQKFIDKFDILFRASCCMFWCSVLRHTMIINNRKLSNKFPASILAQQIRRHVEDSGGFCALVVLTPADDSTRLSAYWDLGVKTVETNFNFIFCFVSRAVVCVWDWNIVIFESISTGSPINTWIAFIQIY